MSTHFNLDKIEKILRSTTWQKEIIMNETGIHKNDNVDFVEIPK